MNYEDLKKQATEEFSKEDEIEHSHILPEVLKYIDLATLAEQKRLGDWLHEHAKQYSSANYGTTIGIIMCAAELIRKGEAV